MGEAMSSQILFEKYVRGEMTLAEAADALEALLRQRKATGADRSDLHIRKPQDWTPSEVEYDRAQALFEELDRRAAMQ